jgi:hypothetical protein
MLVIKCIKWRPISVDQIFVQHAHIQTGACILKLQNGKKQSKPIWHIQRAGIKFNLLEDLRTCCGTDVGNGVQMPEGLLQVVKEVRIHGRPTFLARCHYFWTPPRWHHR